MLRQISLKIAFATIGLSLLASPFVVSADVLSDLQAQIQALMAQIAALQSSQSSAPVPSNGSDDVPTTPSPTSSCPNLTTTMQRGARDATTGGQVTSLQVFLADHFNLNEEDIVSGYFGRVTEIYVIKFQTANGLPAFGIAGSLTRAKIASLCGAMPLPPGDVYFDPLDIVRGQAVSFALVTGQTARGQAPGNNTVTVRLNSVYGNNICVSIGVDINTQKYYYSDQLCLSDGIPNNNVDLHDANGKHANLSVTAWVKEAGRAAFSVKLKTPGPSNGITVTAPNGGEQWEIGQLNTITWAPYSYTPTEQNPARDVNVFLERLDGTTVGQIMDTGKASLHTYFNIGGYNNFAQAGQYYVRVSNKVTGASDRSDAPFTLLARSIDLKINGSDGPVTLTDNQQVTATANISGTYTSCYVNGMRLAAGGDFAGGPVPFVAGTNTYTLFAWTPTGGGSTSVTFTCLKADGTSRSDSVQVNASTVAASIKVMSPNGGELIDPRVPMNVRFSPVGVASVSVALYKNDQWKYWIKKDLVPTGKDVDLVTWTPSLALQGLGEADNTGAIWKIYVTGLKSDRTGYVDDKSDTPFGFTAPTSTGAAAVSSWTASNFAIHSGAPTCVGDRYVGFSQKYNAWVGAQLCSTNTKYKLYMSSTQNGTYYQIADTAGHGQDHCELINPNFTLPNEDVITSGTCTTCGLGNLIDVQNEPVFSRANFGQPFNQVMSTYWADLTTSDYMCGVPIGTTVTPPKQAGVLTVTTDASSPSYQIAAGGSTRVTLGAFKFRATGEAVQMSQIGINVPFAMSTNLIRGYVYDSAGQLLSTATFGPGVNNGATHFTAITGFNKLIPKDTDVTVVIKGDIARIGAGQPGRAGDLIQVSIDSVNTNGTGVSSGLVIRPTGTTNVAGVRIFRSYPTIGRITLPSEGLADGRLIRFSLTANSNGSVGIADIGLRIATVNATFPQGFILYVYSDPAFSTPVPLPGNTLGLNGAGGTSYNEAGSVRTDIQFNGGPLQIPAGGTYYFELRGTPTITSGASATVVTSVIADSVSRPQLLTHTASNPSQLFNDYFIWSPNDLTTSQFSDSDWTNGYQLPGMGASISQTRTGSGASPLSPRITLGTVSAGGVSATYADMPPNSQVVIINQTSGARVNEVSSMLSSQSGTISMPFPPTMQAGTYYLKAQNYSTGAYIAQTVSFYAQTQTILIPLPCPLYMAPACPAGQRLVIDPVTYDSNQCEVPHSHCVTDAPAAVSCTYTPGASKLGGKYAPPGALTSPVTINIEGGQGACSSWCSSQGAEANVYYTCAYNGQTIALTQTQLQSMASVLNAIQSLLQELKAKYSGQ